eukprot:COSAG05_NODE_12395_length_469_cov_36.594595_1_plen_62_part_01
MKLIQCIRDGGWEKIPKEDLPAPSSVSAAYARAAPEEGPRAWRIAYRGERESGRPAREWRGP